MGWMLARRVILGAVALLLLETAVFLGIRLVPGDPAEMMLGDYATPESLAEMRCYLGLDKPLVVQYLSYLGQLGRLDLGHSLRSGRPVSRMILEVLPYTLELVAAGMLLAVVLGLPVGIGAARRQGSWFDASLTVCAVIGVSMPAFWFGMVLILLFGVWLHWFPVLGAGGGSAADRLLHLVLPAAAVGLRQMAMVARVTRASMLECMREDYVRTARAKGLSEAIVTYKHVLRNAGIPVITTVGLQMGILLGGTVVTETLFARPGLGKLLVDSVLRRDYPMVQGLILVWGVLVVAINMVTDVFYGVLDPRVRVR